MTQFCDEIKDQLEKKDNFLYLGNEPFTGVLKKEKDGVLQEINYCNGHQHGLFKSYFHSGEIKEVCLYNKGCLNGRALKYWPNGQKCVNVNYINDKMDGIYEEWNSNGTLVCRKTFLKEN